MMSQPVAQVIKVRFGQNYLSQIADETGGEEYYLGLGAPVSFNTC